MLKNVAVCTQPEGTLICFMVVARLFSVARCQLLKYLYVFFSQLIHMRPEDTPEPYWLTSPIRANS